ncbi:tail fiber protein [Brevundimonas sp. UBA7664]|uniref:tail fiber protein n=1 Tax=Brevundimonas sp. UBA7664 TaxID=1946141 RepID=UPI0025BBAB1F|nr:tail fiber protein [Brevundimonas sp. UBA7664]
MTTLALIVTNAGYAALADAETMGTYAVHVVEIGLTDQVFVGANTLTALPGEHKRVDTIAGEVTGPASLNIVMRDDGGDSYGVKGFGLYLEDGTLFAVYSAGETIVEKSGLASVLLTIDVAFTDVDAALIEFGDMSWTNPAATETVKGVAEIATQAEAEAGADHTRIVSPLVLDSVVRARTITGGGLITGGGDLRGNRVLTLEEASEAEAVAGVNASKAITPRRLKAAIDALIAGAPGALDTLNELSAALGDDPDFAATMTNGLSLKASLAYVDAQLAAAREQLLVERCGTLAVLGYDMALFDPTVMILANGGTASRVDDARLFAKFGTTYGVGDGATTFGLPEWRGEFVRALDLARGIDVGRTHGSAQAQSIQSHSHSIPSNDDSSTGNGYVEDAQGSGTARTASTGATGDTETRPRNIALPHAIWR